MNIIATHTDENDNTRTLIEARNLQNGYSRYLVHTNMDGQRQSILVTENDTNASINSILRSLGGVDIGRIMWRADRGQTCPVEFTIDAVLAATATAPDNRLTVAA